MDIATTPSVQHLLAALRQVRQEVGAIGMDARNAATGSSYASLPHLLEHLEGPLARHDLVLWFAPIIGPAAAGVAGRLDHLPSGEWIATRCLMPVGGSPTPHQVLGGQTYARRAIVQALFNLRVCDDDGNAASGVAAPSAEPQEAPSPPGVCTLADAGVPAAEPEGGATVERGGPGVRPTRRRAGPYSSEALLDRAKAELQRLQAALGEPAARQFLSARISGRFLATARPDLVQRFITDAEALLASPGLGVGLGVPPPAAVA